MPPKKAAPKASPKKAAPKPAAKKAAAKPASKKATKKATKKAQEEESGSDAEAEDAPSMKKARTEGEPKETKAADGEKLSRRSSSNAVTEEAVLAGTVPFQRKTADADFDTETMLKLVTWNVAGLRAVLRKGTQLQDLVAAQRPDVLCVQETKLSDLGEAAETGRLPGYSHVDTVTSGRKGQSGVRTYVRDGMGDVQHALALEYIEDKASAAAQKPEPEGRVVTSAVPGLGDVVNMYVPNSGLKLDRLEYRCETFDVATKAMLAKRCAAGPVVWTGDLNVAERDYDRFFGGTFKQMQKCPGFTPEERTSFRATLGETKMVDAFRQLYPTAHKAYTFWSARFNQRAKGNGWRLDYFIVSACLAARVVDCFALPEYDDSDHCPVVLWLKKK